MLDQQQRSRQLTEERCEVHQRIGSSVASNCEAVNQVLGIHRRGWPEGLTSTCQKMLLCLVLICFCLSHRRSRLCGGTKPRPRIAARQRCVQGRLGAWRCKSPAAATSDLECTHPTQRESRPLISEVELCRCLKSRPSLGTRVKFAWLALLGVEVNPGPLLRLGSSVPRMRFLPSGVQDAMKGPPALPVFSNRIRPSHWSCRMASVLAPHSRQEPGCVQHGGASAAH